MHARGGRLGFGMGHTVRVWIFFLCMIACRIIQLDPNYQYWYSTILQINTLHLLYHQGPLGTVCLQQDSDHVCLWPAYHLHQEIAKHSYSGAVKKSTGEWKDALLSSVMRVGSICMRVMDIHVWGKTWWESSSGVHLPMTRRPHLKLHGVEGH